MSTTAPDNTPDNDALGISGPADTAGDTPVPTVQLVVTAVRRFGRRIRNAVVAAFIELRDTVAKELRKLLDESAKHDLDDRVQKVVTLVATVITGVIRGSHRRRQQAHAAGTVVRLFGRTVKGATT